MYGASSGGALALEAAAVGLPADRIAVFEVPWNVGEDWPPRWRAYRVRLAEAGRADAVEAFLRIAGPPRTTRSRR